MLLKSTLARASRNSLNICRKFTHVDRSQTKFGEVRAASCPHRPSSVDSSPNLADGRFERDDTKIGKSLFRPGKYGQNRHKFCRCQCGPGLSQNWPHSPRIWASRSNSGQFQPKLVDVGRSRRKSLRMGSWTNSRIGRFGPKSGERPSGFLEFAQASFR